MMKLKIILIDFIFWLLCFQIGNYFIFILFYLIFRIKLISELWSWFFRFNRFDNLLFIRYDSLILIFCICLCFLLFVFERFFYWFGFILVDLYDFVLISGFDHDFLDANLLIWLYKLNLMCFVIIWIAFWFYLILLQWIIFTFFIKFEFIVNNYKTVKLSISLKKVKLKKDLSNWHALTKYTILR